MDAESESEDEWEAEAEEEWEGEEGDHAAGEVGGPRSTEGAVVGGGLAHVGPGPGGGFGALESLKRRCREELR